jgi:hypothetical protein
VFSVGADPRLYKEDLGKLESEVRDSLEMAVEDDDEERIFCEKKTRYGLQ